VLVEGLEEAVQDVHETAGELLTEKTHNTVHDEHDRSDGTKLPPNDQEIVQESQQSTPRRESGRWEGRERRRQEWGKGGGGGGDDEERHRD
jgi:hypothetical protein